MSRYAIIPASALAACLAFFLSGCGDECSRAADCPSAQVCYLGTCEALQSANRTCVADSDCNEAGFDLYSCRGSRCVLNNTTRPDSGTTTGTVADGGIRQDAGFRDSGVGMDAGPDGGGPDGGGPDGGGPDGGDRDAGDRDGGDRDGGDRDGGDRDGGDRDAGDRDAG